MFTPLQQRVLDLLAEDRGALTRVLLWKLGEVPGENPLAQVTQCLRRLAAKGLVARSPSAGDPRKYEWRRAKPGEVEPLPPRAQRYQKKDRAYYAADLALVLDGWVRPDAEAAAIANAALKEWKVDREAGEKRSSSIPTPMAFTPPRPVSGVYEIVHKPTGKSYVGQSWDVKGRWDCGAKPAAPCRNRSRCHNCQAKHGSSLPLHNDMRMLGADQFEHRVLERCDRGPTLDDRELFHIAQRVNAGVPTYNLVGVRRHRDPSLFNGKDVDNPHVKPAQPKAAPPPRARKQPVRLTPSQLEDLYYLRAERGYTTVRIALLLDVTPCTVSHAMKRMKRSAARFGAVGSAAK